MEFCAAPESERGARLLCDGFVVQDGNELKAWGVFCKAHRRERGDGYDGLELALEGQVGGISDGDRNTNLPHEPGYRLGIALVSSCISQVSRLKEGQLAW